MMTLNDMSPVQWHQRRLSAMKLERSSYDAHYMELSDNILPRRGRFFDKNPVKGGKINGKIVDSTGTFALNILVAGMSSGVTNAARQWFAMQPPDPDLRDFAPVKAWLGKLQSLMYSIYRSSNLYQTFPTVYEELGLFGTAPMFRQRSFDSVMNFGGFTAGEYWIAQNAEKKVRTVYRQVPMTVKQLVDKYGDKNAGPNTRWNNFSTHTRDAYKGGRYDEWVQTTHAVHENDNHVIGSTLAREMAFEQFVFETSAPSDAKAQPLHRGGFKRFPIYVPRWHLRSAEVYGSSPGMDALGDIKQLQSMEKKKALALAKHVNPPMVATTAMKSERMTSLPGDVTFSDPVGGAQGYAPAYQTQPRLQDFNVDAEAVRARIRRAMFSDLFLIITERPGIQPLNQSEIFERKEEKLLALGPVMERLDDDMLEPLLMDTFQEIMELGLMPAPPPELSDPQTGGLNLQIEYLNVIAMAQRAQGLLGLQDTAGFIGSLAQSQAASNQEVTAWDKFNIDQAIDEYSEKRGVPAGVIRGDDEVQQLRADRAQAAQQQQLLDQVGPLAKAAKDLADVNTTAQNASQGTGIPNIGQGPGLQQVVNRA